MSKYRVKFARVGQQGVWLNSLGLSVKAMAEICACSERTIRDWRRERFLMDYEAMLALCKKTGNKKPKVSKIPRYQHLSAAGRKGGLAVVSKYGRIPIDDRFRLEEWKKWWQTKGQYKKNAIYSPKDFKKPRESAKLAEFVGIMLGDGGISNRQLTITLHSVDDIEYGKYVSELIKSLFNVPVRIRHKVVSEANDYVVSRIGLVEFCVDKLGLIQGHKIRGSADIPKWIKSSEAFSIACLRGLIDTDGSVFLHKYLSKGRIYQYKKLNFSNRSLPLLLSVYESMVNLGLNPKSRGSMICLDGQKDIVRYMKIVGTRNPKHLKRYLK